ncbi:helix-turn-helix domain-containing protein [Pararoseomonas indoligenes]|uniref:Helix-turn-helix transcriptional regulator n=1 Tax=Roseomonas indoligenes TaxID=2820811 RepID=A0A940MY24_9PROT|nr:AraC family transcriptional regulator [Pararoseomonas indoligenes]MBP0496398.1 helix-turn-helix transcriptional regulator [Pararoseomonas indoligenes]
MISNGHANRADGPDRGHPGAEAGAVQRLLRDALDLLDRDHGAAAVTLARATRLLDAAGSGKADRPAIPGGLARWQAISVARYVDANLEGQILQKHLAAQVRLSCGHFGRAFKQSFGVSPHSYVMERRIARAKAMMLESRMPLCDIALSCGLADQAHLSRVFRRLTGSTPLAWRRQHQTAPSQHPLKARP